MRVNNDLMWYFPHHDFMNVKKFFKEDEPEKKKENFVYAGNLTFFRLLRFTGMFPLQIDDETGKMKFGMKTWSFAYTVAVHTLLAGLNVWTLPFLVRNFMEIDFSVFERILYLLLFTFVWLQFVMLLLFYEAPKLAKHMNLWGELTDRILTVTGKTIKTNFTRILIVPYLLAVGGMVAVSGFLHPVFSRIIEDRNLEQPAHNILFILVMGSGTSITIFALFWTIFMKSIEFSAECIISDIESLSWKEKYRSLAKHLNLWLQLRQICNNFGSSIGITYTIFCGSIFMVSIPTLLVAVNELRHGTFFYVFCPIVAIGTITFLAELSERAISKMSREFEERLGAILISGKADEYQPALVNFMQTVASTAPSICIGGYFCINRGINVGLYSSFVTYFVIIVQFQSD